LPALNYKVFDVEQAWQMIHYAGGQRLANSVRHIQGWKCFDMLGEMISKKLLIRQIKNTFLIALSPKSTNSAKLS